MNWLPDDLGNSIKVKVYKDGQDGTELASNESFIELKGFGNAFNTAVVLMSNVSTDEGAYSILMSASTEPDEEPGPCTPDTPSDRWLIEYDYDCDDEWDTDDLWHFKSDGTISDHWLGTISGYSWRVEENKMIISFDSERGMEATFSEDCQQLVDGIFTGGSANPTCWKAKQY